MVWRTQAKNLLLWGGGYFLLAKFSMLFFATQPDNIALLWLPAGLGPYLYYRRGPWVLPAVFMASFCANFPGLEQDSTLSQSLHTSISAFVDTLFVLLAGNVARQHMSGGVNRTEQLFLLLTLGCLLPTALTAALLSANLWWGGYLESGMTLAMGVSIWLADLLGILLVMPLLVAFERRREEMQGVSVSWFLATLFTLGFMLVSFHYGHWLLYFSLPTLMYIVFGSTPLYSYVALTATILIYNALNVRLYHLEVVDQRWLEALAFSISVSFSVIALSVQQRVLRREAVLRKKWEIRASHDHLTGLVNRGVLMSLLAHEIERFQRFNGSFSIAMLDIDHFKAVNDSYGHVVGDQVLVEFSKRLQTLIRGADVVGRMGGEEFLLLLPDTDAASAHHVLDNLRAKAAAEPFCVGGEELRVTFSAGIAGCFRGATPESLLEEADRNLYYAKQAGRNRVSASTRPACES